jgi:hypothetical protein
LPATKCTICRRPQLREAVDRLLLGGTSRRDIEQQFAGEVGVSRTTISRHCNNCLKPKLASIPTKMDKNLSVIEGTLETPDPASGAMSPAEYGGLVKVTWDKPVDSPAAAVGFMQHLLFRVTAILDKAEKSDNPRIALAAVKEVRDTLMAHAKIQGFVRDAPTQDNRTVNIFSGLPLQELLTLKQALGQGSKNAGE